MALLHLPAAGPHDILDQRVLVPTRPFDERLVHGLSVSLFGVFPKLLDAHEIRSIRYVPYNWYLSPFQELSDHRAFMIRSVIPANGPLGFGCRQLPLDMN